MKLKLNEHVSIGTRCDGKLDVRGIGQMGVAKVIRLSPDDERVLRYYLNIRAAAKAVPPYHWLGAAAE